jgi:trans-2,3-dihydro-3-hydroxyanthranilate isomerase
MEVPFRMADVFTDRPLAGNQLCVVSEPVEGLDGHLMQALAREIGFSETTFVQEAAGDRYAMRIFTPGAEMPFAGHPTLGTAFVLASEGRITSPATQVVAAGEFRVEVDLDAGRARVRQLPPRFGSPLDDRGAIASAVGLDLDDLEPSLEPAVVSTGLSFLIVAAVSTDAVAGAQPRSAEIAALLRPAGADGVYLFALDGTGAAKARMFAPELGVAEDPATGSAAGPLGAYLARHGAGGMPGRLLIRQGAEIDRPSELHVEVRPDGDTFEVWVEGGVAIVGRGVFEL